MTSPDTSDAPPGSLLDPKTLRFRARDLKLEYQRATIDQVRRETLVVVPISIVIWLLAGVLLPAFTPIPASVSTTVVVFMTIVLLLAAVPIRRLQTLDQLAALVVALNDPQRGSRRRAGHRVATW